MRKRVVFAVICRAAALSAAAVSVEGASQAQTSGQQVVGHAGQQSGSGPLGQATRAPVIPAGYRPLSLKEGRALAEGIAWADDEEGLAPDCSHLVHILYQQAGYSYPYASSVELYRGTGQFLRVRHAQPGDLVVWRGHVGIVVNPREDSFFSTTSSGARIENYRSPYWRARGYPRFYRYLTKGPLTSTSGATQTASRTAREPNEQAVPGGGENQPSLQTVKATPAATNGPRGDGVRGKTHDDAASESVRLAQNSLQPAPWAVLIPTAGKQPKAADVTSALEAANREAGEMLRAGDLEKLERPVVVYRQLQVSGVEVKGKRGTAQMQVETVATLTPERMESQLGWEDHELELLRTKKGWVMSGADQNIYVPRDGAMRVLAARLAALTQSAERSTEKDREQADIVRFLNLLIE